MTIEDNLGADADAAYAALMQAHLGLSEEESHQLNARLVLILMNEAGSADRFREILRSAEAI